MKIQGPIGAFGATEEGYLWHFQVQTIPDYGHPATFTARGWSLSEALANASKKPFPELVADFLDDAPRKTIDGLFAYPQVHDAGS